MKIIYKPVVLLLVTLMVSITAAAQTVIDATVRTGEQQRSIKSGRAGSIGRKLPIQVTLEFPDTNSSAQGLITVAFVLTNTGGDDLLIPISLHEHDFESKSKDVPYTVQHLHLLVTGQEGVLAGGANLYGNDAHPETILKLAPGKWLRVFARVRVLDEPVTQKKGTTLIAHVILDIETLKTVHGETTLDSQEIGSARSAEYNWKR
jgi:hypothetical protein